MQQLSRRDVLQRTLLGATALVLGADPGETTALSQTTAAPGVTVLSFWGGWTGPDGLVMQKLVSRFNSEVRDVQVVLSLYNWDLIFDRWRAEFDGGSPPDIVGIHATEVAEFADLGMLRDISHVAQAGGLSEADFLPAPWKLCEVDEGLYAIPLDIHPLGLYINATAARRAGLDPDRPPQTGSELLSWAARLTDHPKGLWGYAAPAGDVECFRQWFSLLYQYGGRFLDSSGTRCLADSTAGIAALTRLRTLIGGNRVAMPEEGSADADFLAGRVLMYLQGPWYIRGIHRADFSLVTAPMPRIGTHRAVWANSHVLGVVNTQDQSRVTAAMRFIIWIHQHALDWAESGQVPASTAARMQLATTSIWPSLKPFAAQLPYIVYQPNLAAETQLFAEQLATPLTSPVRAAMLGQQTPADAARAMSQGVNTAIAATR